MIRGIDFYEFVLGFCDSFENVEFCYDEIVEIRNNDAVVEVTTKTEVITSSYVFNSTSLFYPEVNRENSLLQHFEGWVIETADPFFDENVGTLMDFRLDQSHGTTFMYVLPTSPRGARGS